MYIQNNYSYASLDYNDYYFSYSCGILIMSLFVFVLYCIYEKNNPKVDKDVVMPGLLAGFLWSLANVCYNLGTNSLSMSITVPITSSGPSCVAFIAAFMYKEIRGRQNIMVLLIGCTFAITGSIFCGYSL